MTSSNGSYSGPRRSPALQPGEPEQSAGHVRLIGEEWIEHGYRASPIFDEVEPCAICDAPNQTCTHFTSMSYEGNSMSRLTPSSLPEPDNDYIPGSFVESDSYDDPKGSQAFQPEKREELPTQEDDFELKVDPDDSDYGLLTGVKPNPDNVGSAPIDSYLVDEDGDYVVVPQE